MLRECDTLELGGSFVGRPQDSCSLAIQGRPGEATVRSVETPLGWMI